MKMITVGVCPAIGLIMAVGDMTKNPFRLSFLRIFHVTLPFAQVIRQRGKLLTWDIGKSTVCIVQSMIRAIAEMVTMRIKQNSAIFIRKVTMLLVYTVIVCHRRSRLPELSFLLMQRRSRLLPAINSLMEPTCFRRLVIGIMWLQSFDMGIEPIPDFSMGM